MRLWIMVYHRFATLTY